MRRWIAQAKIESVDEFNRILQLLKSYVGTTGTGWDAGFLNNQQCSDQGAWLGGYYDRSPSRSNGWKWVTDQSALASDSPTSFVYPAFKDAARDNGTWGIADTASDFLVMQVYTSDIPGVYF